MLIENFGSEVSVEFCAGDEADRLIIVFNGIFDVIGVVESGIVEVQTGIGSDFGVGIGGKHAGNPGH